MFKEFGNKPIQVDNTAGPITSNKKKVLDFILESYAHFDAITLSAMTHEEDPWEQTPKNKVISDQAIKAFYSQQPFAQNFPLSENKPYYPVYTDFMYSFIFDFQEGDEAKKLVFDSFDEYKQLMQQSKKDLNNYFTFESA